VESVGTAGSGVIVVGVDGSEHSRRALRWAIAEALARHSRLRVVTAWSLPMALYGQIGVAGYDEAAVEFRARAEEFCREAAGEAAAAGVTADVAVVEGHGAEVLVDAAHDAELLVVGSRGRGGFVGLLLGSVSAQCSHHAHCPVVIVR
jgi:nucleotide-binding universal stress UspA family protein